MPTKQQLRAKASAKAKRCQHRNEEGALDCNKIGIYYKCNEDGTSFSTESRANRKCCNHKSEGQIHAPNQRQKFKRQHPGKGAQPKTKKMLRRKRPSNSQKSSSSASTCSSKSWSSKDSYSSSDSNYSYRVAGNNLYFVSGPRIDLIFSILPF